MSFKKNLSYKAFSKSKYKSIKHSTYFEVYDELFSKYRNKKITFVEIGILSGGSLFMWRNFFGPRARIIGIDLNPKAKKWSKYGFEIFIGDQSDINFWKKFKKKVGKIDIILDDGGHRYVDQITSIECILSNIKHNGLIVVEDTHTSYLNGFGDKKYSLINYIKNIIDKINHKSHRLKSTTSMENIWSIKVYESVVAIFVKSKQKQTISAPITNYGINDNAKDFRVEKSKRNKSFVKILNKVKNYFR
tara:strand:- start:1279 stop:2019 length:741 start_codon:yes stop_codon:yes gene_type:complete